MALRASAFSSGGVCRCTATPPALVFDLAPGAAFHHTGEIPSLRSGSALAGIHIYVIAVRTGCADRTEPRQVVNASRNFPPESLQILFPMEHHQQLPTFG